MSKDNHISASDFIIGIASPIKSMHVFWVRLWLFALLVLYMSLVCDSVCVTLCACVSVWSVSVCANNVLYAVRAYALGYCTFEPQLTKLA